MLILAYKIRRKLEQQKKREQKKGEHQNQICVKQLIDHALYPLSV
jgi:hypothetical protein